MMKKATDQAKVETDSIRARAEEETAQFINQRKAEAKAAAEKEAEAIKADARHQAKMIRERQLEGIGEEAANLAQKLQNDLIADIEVMKKSVMALSTKFSTTTINTVSNDGQENGKRLSEEEKAEITDYAQWLEIEIMPPIDIDKIMNLISYLERLPEVKTTDVLPDTPNPIIRVFLGKPLALAAVLLLLPQIAQVNEVVDITELITSSGKNGKDFS